MRKADKAIAFLSVVGLVACVAVAMFFRRQGTDWATIISIAGSLGSVIGFVIVLIQLYAVREATEGTHLAVEQTKTQLERAASIADVSRVVKMMEQVQHHAGEKKVELAWSRLQDVRSLLIQLTNSPGFDRYVDPSKFNRLLVAVGVEITDLYGSVFGTASKFDAVRLSKTLDSIIAVLVKFEYDLKFDRNSNGKLTGTR